MSHRIFTELVQYERARLRFCQIIAESATRPHFISFMESEGVIELIHPLLCDPEMAVRLNAVCCVSRMANQSIAIAKKSIELHIPEIVLKEFSLERNNNFHYHRAVTQALKAIAKHSVDLARNIVNCGGLKALLICLDSSDPLLKENSCCGIGCIVRQSPEYAMTAINQGVVVQLLMNLQQSEMNLKQISTLVLSDIAKHTPNHAEAILKFDGLAYLAGNVESVDVKLKKHTLSALANIASHNPDLAARITEWNIIPKALIHLSHDSALVQKYSAQLIQEIVKHNIELAQIVVNDGGIGALVQMLFNAGNLKDDVLVAGATALGYIAGISPYFAMAIIESKGITALSMLLDNNRPNCQLVSCAWALGHIGKHSSEHCRPIAEAQLFAKMMEIYDASNDKDLKSKLKECLKSCIHCCLDVPALEILLYNAPADILEMVLEQFAKILPNNEVARKMFLTTGPLRKVLAIEAELDSNVALLIESIKSCYSNEVIRMYSPRLPEPLMNSLDTMNAVPQFKPQDFFVSPNVDDNISTDASLKSSIA